MRVWKFLSIILLLSLLGTGVAQAQQDIICICTDPEDPLSCGGNVNVEAFGTVTLYLCILNPSGPWVTAWEAQVETVTEASIFEGWTLVSGVNVGSGIDYIVGNGDAPLQPNDQDVIVLMYNDIAVISANYPVEYYVRRVPGSLSFDETPGYSPALGVLTPLWVCSGDPYLPVFTINGPDDPPPVFPEFTMNISAEVGELSDNDNIAGTILNATDGYDVVYDSPEPPPSPSDYVTLYFDHPEWSSPFGDRFMRDMRSLYFPLEETKIWPIAVETDHSSTVTLTFTPDDEVDDQWGLYLHDPVDDWTVDLRLTDFTFEFQSINGQTEVFELWVGPPVVVEPQPVYREIPVGWSLIGYPLIPPPPGNIGQALLQNATDTVFLYGHEGDQGYVVRSAGDPAVQGEALWVGATEAFTWNMPGGVVDVDGVSVPLHEGWSMVGYPLWLPTTTEGVMVERYGDRYSWSTAVANGWLSGIVYDYDTVIDDYVQSDTFQTWRGYWVASHQPDLSLWFHHSNVTAPGKAPVGGPEPDDIDWQLSIAVDDLKDAATFGVSRLATEGFDARFDLPVPPMAPNAAPSSKLRFEHPEWELAVGSSFATDYRPPVEPPYYWDTILTAPEPGIVALGWESSNLPVDSDLQVYLPQQNRVVVMSMREDSRVMLEVGDEPLLVRFRSPDMSTDVPGLLADNELVCRPNPFNPRTEIELRTAQAGDMALDVYDVRGRRVRVFPLGELNAGVVHEVTWDGRDEAGREVAGGTYFAVLVLDGRRTGTMAKLMLVR